RRFLPDRCQGFKRSNPVGVEDPPGARRQRRGAPRQGVVRDIGRGTAQCAVSGLPARIPIADSPARSPRKVRNSVAYDLLDLITKHAVCSYAQRTTSPPPFFTHSPQALAMGAPCVRAGAGCPPLDGHMAATSVD